MDVPIDLHKWLMSAGAVNEYDVRQTLSTKVVLHQDAMQLFEIGFKLQPLLKRLQALKVRALYLTTLESQES